MASKFITNKKGERSLAERIQDLIQNSSHLDFLVGYFFFSGFCDVYKDLTDKPLRILVGMDADIDVNNCIREYTSYSDNHKNVDSKLTIKNKYFDNLQTIINKSDTIDHAKFESSYRTFIKKLENGTLEVRKTREPHHAKMYLFHSLPKQGEIEDDGKVIIGSSNFSLQGLRARNEINVYLQDEHDFVDGKQIFNELWDDSIPIINYENKEDFKARVLAHTWLETVPTPYLMYIRVLYEYFKSTDEDIKTPKEITRDRMNRFFDVAYQTDAIRDGLAKVKKHSGCIIADVVGLGKSVIASAIAANLDKTTLIITPPHLKSQWEDYGSDFGLKGCKVYSSGKIKEALNENKNCSNLLIIIDEAHRYRNENTEAYGYLHQLCAGNQVILLSATPFNNKPEDIFALIKLFQIPANSTIQTVNNLGNQMEHLIREYKKLKKEHHSNKYSEAEFVQQSRVLAEKIREILDPVVIRRTRIDLEKRQAYKTDLEAQGIQFSDVQAPVSKTYELGTLSDLYIKTLANLTGDKNRKIGGFKGTRYKPLTYLKKDQTDKGKIDKRLIKKYKIYFDDMENFSLAQRNMADFIKQLLVRRFESSKYGFIKSLENSLTSMESLKQWFVELKKIPMTKKVKLPDVEDLIASLSDDTEGLFKGTDEIFQCTLSKENEKGVWYIDAEDITEDFLKDLDSDINLIRTFIQEWKEVTEDPKLQSIKTDIRTALKEEPQRKIIIFTEFSDTAEYLFNDFTKFGLRAMMYSSKTATKEKREDIRNNFDAGPPENLQRNNYDILIATDAISEGFSLHRAGTIYNYDIPYNPTRVIQRVGRINRINKKVFDKLFIYNFFPSATGEKISHTAEISTFKMKLFQAILGADTKILTEDETLDGYFGRQFSKAENEENSVSWDIPFREELDIIKNTEKDFFKTAKALPQRCRIARKNINYLQIKRTTDGQELFEGITEKGVLLFSKKGDAYRFCFAAKDGSTVMTGPQQALTLFKASKNDSGNKVSDMFYPLYERAKAESGIIKTSGSKSTSVQEALKIVNFLINKTVSDNDKEYLEALRNTLCWDSIPDFYVKQIAKLKVGESDLLTEIKGIVPESYIEMLIEKNAKVGNEPETILLAEELQ